MKKIILLNCILMLVVNVTGQSKDDRAVAEVVEKLRVAMINADKTALENLAAEGLSYGHSGGVVEDKREFIEKIISGKSDFVSIELSEQTISIHGNTAIVRHNFKGVTNNNGQPGEVQLKVLLVWQKQDRKWKLLARQAVKIT
jgi:ketosteroid isomerase-like protein